ncbi:MAG: transcriptional regulator [Verrucomicrobiae bacterium]|nr:transcriptional regulator [Verrucomicrobiae bacterium]
MTQEQLSARLQLAGLDAMDRVTVAKIEAQIRSVYDYELALIAAVLNVPIPSLFPGIRLLKTQLDSLSKGTKD